MLIRALLLLVSLAGVALILIQQFRQHRESPGVIGIRLLRLRIFSSSLMILLIAMLLFNKPILAGRAVLFALYYWVIFLVVLLGLMGVTLLDLHELRRSLHQSQEQSPKLRSRRPSRNGDTEA